MNSIVTYNKIARKSTVVFNLNGSIMECAEDSQQVLQEAIPGNTPLYPTVSLLSPYTRVVGNIHTKIADRIRSFSFFAVIIPFLFCSGVGFARRTLCTAVEAALERPPTVECIV